MTLNHLKYLAVFCLFGFSHQLAFGADLFYEVERLYERQDFHQVVDTLDEIKPKTREDKATKEYFRGLALKGMGDYDNAAKSYARSIRLGIKRKDIYYEYGQALYAANDLDRAQKAFKKSVSIGFKTAVSTYYIAYTHQLLEQYKKAKISYSKVLKNPESDKDMKQIAHFQLAEVFFQMANPRENPRILVKKYVLPQFKRAIDVDPNTRLARDIRKRELEVRRRFGLDPNTLINGRRISPKKYQLSFSQLFAYDSNITQATDLASVQTTNRDSHLLDTNIRGSYRFVFKSRYILKPELRLRKLHHTNRDEATVFRNDTLSMTPALKTSFEHRVNNSPASFFFDYEYGYISRDQDQDKDLSYYARSHQFTLGEKFRFFDVGDTTIKAQYRDYDAFSNTLSSQTYNFGIDQIAVLPNKHILLGFFLSSLIRSDAAANELNYFLFRLDYLIPEIFPKYTLHLAQGLAFLDTPDPTLDAARGLELEINPSVRIIKRVTKKFSVSFGHSFSKRFSDDDVNRSYKKHVSDFELKYSF